MIDYYSCFNSLQPLMGMIYTFSDSQTCSYTGTVGKGVTIYLIITMERVTLYGTFPSDNIKLGDFEFRRTILNIYLLLTAFHLLPTVNTQTTLKINLIYLIIQTKSISSQIVKGKYNFRKFANSSFKYFLKQTRTGQS